MGSTTEQEFSLFLEYADKQADYNNVYVNEFEKLMESYLAGVELKTNNKYGVASRVNGSTHDCTVTSDVSVVDGENRESGASTSTSTRGRRTAAQIASLKVKKSLNIPFKLRRPTNGEAFEGVLISDNEVEKISNPSSTTTTTNTNNCSNGSQFYDANGHTEGNEQIPDIDENNSTSGQTMRRTLRSSTRRTRLNHVETVNKTLNKSHNNRTKVIVKSEASCSSTGNQINVNRLENCDEIDNRNSPCPLNLPANGTYHVHSTVSTDDSPDVPLSIVKMRTKQFERHASIDPVVNSNVATTSNVECHSSRDFFEVSPSSQNNEEPSAQLSDNKISQNNEGASTESTNNKTYVTKSNIENNSTVSNQTQRITRAMANSVNTAGSSQSSTQSKSSSRKNKKLSASYNCKRLSKARSAKSKRDNINPSKIPQKEKKIRNHDERLNKVKAARKAQMCLQLKAEEEAQRIKAEKLQKIALEKEKKLKEEEARRAAAAQQKRLEVEERRKKEEAARLARLEEIEEEHKRADAAIKKKKDNLEAMRQNKQASELRLNVLKMPLQQIVMKADTSNNNKNKINPNATRTIDCQSYEMTPPPNEKGDKKVLKPPKTKNDYGIDDVNSEDSSEDEENPKKMIPSWAKRNNRELGIKICSYIPLGLWVHTFKCDKCPQVNELVNPQCKRPRTSSAIWSTPPLRQ